MPPIIKVPKPGGRRGVIIAAVVLVLALGIAGAFITFGAEDSPPPTTRVVIGPKTPTPTPEPPAKPSAPIPTEPKVAEPRTPVAPPVAKPPPRRVRVAKVKVSLSPIKAVYALADQPRLRAVALDAKGAAIKRPGKIRWTVQPARSAVVRGERLRFDKESRGKVKGCIQGVCGTARFMSLDDTGLP